MQQRLCSSIMYKEMLLKEKQLEGACEGCLLGSSLPCPANICAHSDLTELYPALAHTTPSKLGPSLPPAADGLSSMTSQLMTAQIISLAGMLTLIPTLTLHRSLTR